jgi:hypothetical protein
MDWATFWATFSQTHLVTLARVTKIGRISALWAILNFGQFLTFWRFLTLGNF